MAMTKKDFIALADLIKARSDFFKNNPLVIESLADFCEGQNPNFKRGRWIEYIHGNCGPSGGKVKDNNRGE